MDTSHAAAAQAPRVTLADLPPELKTEIARMAQQQDQAYRSRIKQETGRRPKLAPAATSSWTGRGLIALRLVNRDWSKIASTLLFETIESYGCSNDVYSLEISPNYTNAIRHAVFEPASYDEDDHKSLLRSLLFCTNLRRLTFEQETAGDLLGFEEDEVAEAEHLSHRNAVKRLGKTVQELVLVDVGQGGVPRLPDALPNLRLLDLTLSQDPDHEDPPWDRVRSHLSSLSQLCHLVLRELDPWSQAVFAADHEWQCKSKLLSLELYFHDHPFNLAAFDFIKQFVALEVLKLDMRLGGVDHALDALIGDASSTLVLPKLRGLTLEGGPESIITVVRVLFACPVCRLTLLLSLPSDLSTDTKEQTVTTLVKYAVKTYKGSLRECHLAVERGGKPSGIRAGLSRDLQRVATRNTVNLSLNGRFNIFVDRKLAYEPESISDNEHAVTRRCDAAEEVLRFGLQYAARAKAMGDFRGAETLLHSLHSLEALRTWDKD